MPEIHRSDKRQGLHPGPFSRARVDSIENSPTECRKTDGKCESQVKGHDAEGAAWGPIRNREKQLHILSACCVGRTPGPLPTPWSAFWDAIRNLTERGQG